MVPADSDRVTRAPTYSGYRPVARRFRVRGYHPLRPAVPDRSASPLATSWRPYYPVAAETAPVWAFPISLATTPGITLVFSSSGYLDVSVPRVRLPPTGGMARLPRAGLPHSEIPGSPATCASPGLIAACHVLHRLRKPRHPPCALTHFPGAEPDPPAPRHTPPRALADPGGLSSTSLSFYLSLTTSKNVYRGGHRPRPESPGLARVTPAPRSPAQS